MLHHSAEAVAEADDVRDGWFRVFGQPAVWLGTPPDWSALAPLADDAPPPSLDLTEHWTATRLDQVPGDIKLLWEPSRFGWVYPMVRAYRATGQDAYAEACWELILSWRQANKPNAGANWISAQEVAVRLMALTFAFYGLAPWLKRKASRIARLATMIVVHAARIPPTLDYARAQRNNHLLVEGVGLYTAGVLFPEVEAAAGWKRTGLERAPACAAHAGVSRRRVRAALGQLPPPGASGRHVGRQPGTAQPGTSATRSAGVDPAAGRALGELVDPADGHAPNFGPNDGAYILPLSDGEFEDFRPALQAAACLLDERALYPSGAWDEACVWLGIETPAKPGAADAPVPMDLPDAGLFLLTGDVSRGLLRSARFTSRPGHSDQLHFDLRSRRQPVAIDAGTYLYNALPPWDNALAYAAAHNTVLVDDQEPMRRGGPFLWLEWAQARVLGRWRSAGRPIGGHHRRARWVSAHRRSPPAHGRARSSQLWLVVDDLLGSGEHTARLGWLLADGKWTLRPGQPGHPLPAPARGNPIRRTGGSAALYRGGELIAGSATAGEGTGQGLGGVDVCRTSAGAAPGDRIEGDSCLSG